MKNEEKITFNKDIDSSINGFALVVAFIIMGGMLQFDNKYFGNSTNTIKIIFIITGLLGLFTEMSSLNKKNSIKGLDDLGGGLFLFISLLLIKTYVNTNNWNNFFIVCGKIFLFIMIFISIYMFSSGTIKMIYSVYKNYCNKTSTKEKNKNLFSNIIVILSQLCGVALMVAQIYDIFS